MVRSTSGRRRRGGQWEDGCRAKDRKREEGREGAKARMRKARGRWKTGGGK